METTGNINDCIYFSILCCTGTLFLLKEQARCSITWRLFTRCVHLDVYVFFRIFKLWIVGFHYCKVNMRCLKNTFVWSCIKRTKQCIVSENLNPWPLLYSINYTAAIKWQSSHATLEVLPLSTWAKCPAYRAVDVGCFLYQESFLLLDLICHSYKYIKGVYIYITIYLYKYIKTNSLMMSLAHVKSVTPKFDNSADKHSYHSCTMFSGPVYL